MHLAADHTPSAQAEPDSELAALLAYTTVLGFLPAPPHCLSSQRPGWHRGQDGLSCWPVRPRILFKTISIVPRREPLPHKVLFEPIPYSFWTFSLTAPAQHISETLVKYCKLVLPQCVCWRLFLLYRMFCSWDLGLTSSAVSMKRPWDHLRSMIPEMLSPSFPDYFFTTFTSQFSQCLFLEQTVSGSQVQHDRLCTSNKPWYTEPPLV